MELDLNKIDRLKKIRSEKSELSREENTLASPILKDQSLIREIYGMFVEILSERVCPPNPARVLDLERQAGAAGARQLKSVQLTIF